MALRDQPYLPLYIQDFLTDEKLVECSAAANGVLIRLMCLLHKEEVYGKVRLKEKYKISDDILANFSEQFSKNMPYKAAVILDGLRDLFKEKVIQIRGDVLSQKRMVSDGELSDKRSKSGKTGGEKTAKQNKIFATEFAKAKDIANTEYEYEYEIENENLTSQDRGVGKGDPAVVVKLTPAGPTKFNFDTAIPPWTLEAVERNQYSQTGTKNTAWIIQQWDIFVIERENDPPLKRVSYLAVADIAWHFTNWLRNKKPNNGQNTSRATRTLRDGTPDPSVIKETGFGEL